MNETLDDLSEVVKSKTQILEDKLTKAKSIMERIVQLKTSEYFLSSQEIEIIRENSSKKMASAIFLQETHQSRKNDPSFLSTEEIQKLNIFAETIKSKLYLKEDTFSL